MSGDAPGPRYSWVVRDCDDEPWTLLGYRWTDRESALEEASHWLNCSRHRYAQVKTVEVVGDEWTEVEPPAPRDSRRGADVAGGVSHLLVPRERIRPEWTPGTPLPPTVFLPMTEAPSPPPGLSRETFARLCEAMRREGIAP